MSIRQILLRASAVVVIIVSASHEVRPGCRAAFTIAWCFISTVPHRKRRRNVALE